MSRLDDLQREIDGNELMNRMLDELARRCACGRVPLDGHLTCGRVECDEGAARARWIAERY